MHIFDHIPASLDLFQDLVNIAQEFPGEFFLLELHVSAFIAKVPDQDKSTFLTKHYRGIILSFLVNVQLVIMHLRKSSNTTIIILGQSLLTDSAVPSNTWYDVTNKINSTLRNLCTAMEILYVVTYPIADCIAATNLMPSNSIDAAYNRQQLLLEAIHKAVLFLKKIRKPTSTTGLKHILY